MALSKNKESEAKFVIPLVAVCAAVIIGLHWWFWPEFRILTHDRLFIAVDVAGFIAFSIFALISWFKRNDPNYDKFRWFVAIAAAIICIWVGAWCSQYRQDKNSGIEYKYGRDK